MRQINQQNSLFWPILAWRQYCAERENNLSVAPSTPYDSESTMYPPIMQFFYRFSEQITGSDTNEVLKNIEARIDAEMQGITFSESDYQSLLRFFKQMQFYCMHTIGNTESGFLADIKKSLTREFDPALMDADSQKLLENERVQKNCGDFPYSVLMQTLQLITISIDRIEMHLGKLGFLKEIFIAIEQHNKLSVNYFNDHQTYWNWREKLNTLTFDKQWDNVAISLQALAIQKDIAIEEVALQEFQRLQLRKKTLEDLELTLKSVISQQPAESQMISQNVMAESMPSLQQVLMPVQKQIAIFLEAPSPAVEPDTRDIAAFSQYAHEIVERRIQAGLKSMPLKKHFSSTKLYYGIRERLHRRWCDAKAGWSLLPWYKKALIGAGIVIGIGLIVAGAVFLPGSEVVTLPGGLCLTADLIAMAVGGMVTAGSLGYLSYHSCRKKTLMEQKYLADSEKFSKTARARIFRTSSDFSDEAVGVHKDMLDGNPQVIQGQIEINQPM